MDLIVSWTVPSLLLSLASFMASETPVSRTMAINFLNRMAQEGCLTHREATGRGGHKRLYRPGPEALDEEAFRKIIAGRIMRKALEEIATNPRRGG